MLSDFVGFQSRGLSSSAIVDNQHNRFDNEARESLGRSDNSKSKLPVPIMGRKILNDMPSRPVHLSNSERLLLRKQALKMKKRPVLAVGNFISILCFPVSLLLLNYYAKTVVI